MGASLNLQQTLTGTFQSGTGAAVPGGGTGTLWKLNQQEFAAIDPNGITRAEMGNLNALGVSPAQWGFRASDAGGVPIMDSQGLTSVMQSLAVDGEVLGINVTSTSFTQIGTSKTYVVPRALKMYFLFYADANMGSTAGKGQIRLNTGGGAGVSAALQFAGPNMSNGMLWLYPSVTVAAGSYTIQMEGLVPGGSSMFVDQIAFQAFLLGS
jgi:hypothetical protein